MIHLIFIEKEEKAFFFFFFTLIYDIIRLCIGVYEKHINSKYSLKIKNGGMFLVLNTIKLVNYRNYENLLLSFSENINIIVGNNALGKTNILESIYVLALTKSFRTSNDINLVQKGYDRFIIEGNVTKNNFTDNLKINYSKNKNVYLNDKKVNKLSDYLSHLNVIVFSPDDLELIKGYPDVRRKYLNTEISQLYPIYCKNLSEYNKLLKMRNDCIRKIKFNEYVDQSYLSVLESYLIDKAINIYKVRNKYLNKISLYSKEIYKNTMLKDNFNIRYRTQPYFEEFSDDCIRKNMKKAFLNNFKEEIKYGSTLFGPHKDDFDFCLDDENLKIIGSQSQQKLAVLVFKLAEIELFKLQLDDYPVLLLDDIFSELDDTRKNNVLSYLKKNIQTFITTTDLTNVSDDIKNDSKIFNINNHEITEI